MPSSGARSGTRPSRPKPAGTGRPSDVTLACGHTVWAEPVAIFPSRRTLYACPDGCGLQEKTRRRADRVITDSTEAI